MILPFLYIDTAGEKGRGVFTDEAIPAETTIELSPVIVLGNNDREWLDKTLLHDYIFEWRDTCCMALGYVPIYNHSYQSNCEYFMDYEEDTILIKTVRDVRKGEELTINYNGDWDTAAKVWFDASE